MNNVDARINWRGGLSVVLCVAVLALAGCEREAQLNAASAERAKPIHRFDHFQSVAGNGQRLVGVGAFGVVAVSADGGTSWRRQELAGAPGLIKVAACGDAGFAALDADGVVWRAGSDAAQWTPNKLPATDTVLDLTCTSDNHLWVVGTRGAIFSSVDGAKSWKDQSLSEDIQLLNVQFPTPEIGVIAGEFGRVLLSRDAGVSWSDGGSLGPEFYPQGMDFADAQHGFVVGLGGAVLETTDGGHAWVRGKAPTEAPLYGVLASGEPLVAGAAGLMFHRVGGAWKPVAGVPPTDLRGLLRIPSGVMLAGAGLLASVPNPASN